jgi:hypothetical protein
MTEISMVSLKRQARVQSYRAKNAVEEAAGGWKMRKYRVSCRVPGETESGSAGEQPDKG